MTSTHRPAAIAATEPDENTFKLLEAHKRLERLYYSSEFANDAASERQLDKLGDELEELTQNLARVQPTSIGGVAAMLRYTALENGEGTRWPTGDNGEWRKTLHESLASALEKIARA